MSGKITIADLRAVLENAECCGGSDQSEVLFDLRGETMAVADCRIDSSGDLRLFFEKPDESNICPECGHDIRVMCADGRAERENGDACDDRNCPMMEPDAPEESEADAAAAHAAWEGLTDAEKDERIREAGK